MNETAEFIIIKTQKRSKEIKYMPTICEGMILIPGTTSIPFSPLNTHQKRGVPCIQSNPTLIPTRGLPNWEIPISRDP